MARELAGVAKTATADGRATTRPTFLVARESDIETKITRVSTYLESRNDSNFPSLAVVSLTTVLLLGSGARTNLSGAT